MCMRVAGRGSMGKPHTPVLEISQLGFERLEACPRPPQLTEFDIHQLAALHK